jgi:hypothetical protein
MRAEIEAVTKKAQLAIPRSLIATLRFNTLLERKRHKPRERDAFVDRKMSRFAEHMLRHGDGHISHRSPLFH